MALPKFGLFLLLLAVAVGIGGAAYAAGEGWLGVMLQPLTDDLREAMTIGKDVEGVLVSDVVAGSPAEAAGFAKGDVIVEIDGTTVTSTEQAISQVKSRTPGDKVKFVVVRGGKREVMTAALGTREVGEQETPESKDYYNLKIPRVERIFKDFRPEPGGYLGVKVQDISDDLGQYFGVGEGEGVLVLDVMEDTPAERAGLKAGDVITKVDGEEVCDSGELVSYMRDREPGQKVDLTFKRNRETRRAEVELDKSRDAKRVFIKQMGDPGGMAPPCVDAPGAIEVRREMMRPGELREDLKREIDDMKAEIDRLKKEIESLKK
jgi:predicted metalloprotease with PDZ domain